MKLVSRKSWKAKSPKGKLSTNITPSSGGVAIHYVGSKGKLAGSHSKCAGIVRSIQNSHLANKSEGWIDIAYNFLVCQHGYVFEGRGLHKRSGANGSNSGNQYYYGICALVNASDDISSDLIAGLKDACQYVRTKGGAGSKVVGHRNLYNTDCPGDKLYKYVTNGTFKKGGNNDSYPGRLIRKGQHSSVVRKVQKQLIKKGERLPKYGADSWFGDETVKAVKSFQKSHGLDDDGIVGPKTWGKLF